MADRIPFTKPEYDRSPVGSACGLRAQTTLEQCVDQQRTNSDYINNIGNRIAELLGRLKGYGLKGECGGDGERESEGILGDHLTALQFDASRLGEIQSDLAELESLL